MYVYKRQVTAHRGIATLVVLALVLWAVGTHMFTQSAEAAQENLTSMSDLLTNSAPSETSVHTISFGIPNGMNVGQIFTVQYPSGFDLSSLVVGDISMTVGGDATTTGAAAGVGTWGVGIGSDFISFETPTDAPGAVASSTTLVLTIGDEAGTMIVNPSATTSYEITVGNDATTTMQDTGQTRVAIIDDVYVSANINTSLGFTVQGTTTGAVCNGAPGTFAGSSNDALPFDTLAAGVAKTLCQDLTVNTNALNGYVVTVEQDQDLQSSTGGVIDSFADGAYDTIPAAWASPSNNIGDDTTWGHWGLTSSDATTTRANEFGSDEWVAASTTPIVIMGHTGPSDGTTDGIGRASIGYQVEITALQEAGDDYNTTLTYIATPTF